MTTLMGEKLHGQKRELHISHLGGYKKQGARHHHRVNGKRQQQGLAMPCLTRVKQG
jgi:hypothetical protein